MDIGLVLFVLWTLLLISWEIHRTYFRKKLIEINKNLIEVTFKNHKASDAFDPASAVIVRDRYEAIGRAGTPVTLHRICRFRDGYFLFICTAGEIGYFTQLSPDRVINALRSTPEILQKEFPNAT